VALSLLMLPTVLLTAEQALYQVPQKMREAAIGLGATPFQVAFKIVLPNAIPGILTGVMLAVSRAAGETAPLIFTASFSTFWLESLNEPAPSLAVLIFNFARGNDAHQIEMAWSASLVLVVMVLCLNIAGRMLTKPTN
jgi:phosphate transport system permease protein